MKITKIGHSCILIEENGVRILTDPGNMSAAQNELKDLHIILITHNHQDHLDLSSLKIILRNNPNVKIITNREVGKTLDKEKIPYSVVENNQKITENGILIEGFGEKHALIHKSIPQSINTGYLIANRLFFPGDDFIPMSKPVEILALPISAPWTSFGDAIDYAVKINPKIVFPIHEGLLKSPIMVYKMPTQIFEKLNLKFIGLEAGQSFEF